MSITLLSGGLDPSLLRMLSMFFWGAFGSIASDVVDYVESFTSSDAIPRSKRRGFLLSRLLMAGIAGGLAIGLDANTPASAIYIGAAAPIIVRRLALASNERVERSAASVGPFPPKAVVAPVGAHAEIVAPKA